MNKTKECNFQWVSKGLLCTGCETLYENLECDPLNFCPNCGRRIIQFIPLENGDDIKDIDYNWDKYIRFSEEHRLEIENKKGY